MTEVIHERAGVAADSAARTVIGHVGEVFPQGTVEVKRVVVEQTQAADADFNIEVGGADVFSAEQSVATAGTPEGFAPDQNRYEADETAQVAVDVSSASATAGSLLHVTVVTETVGEEA